MSIPMIEKPAKTRWDIRFFPINNHVIFDDFDVLYLLATISGAMTPIVSGAVL